MIMTNAFCLDMQPILVTSTNSTNESNANDSMDRVVFRQKDTSIPNRTGYLPEQTDDEGDVSVFTNPIGTTLFYVTSADFDDANKPIGSTATSIVSLVSIIINDRLFEHSVIFFS
jgi:hypothetical protein